MGIQIDEIAGEITRAMQLYSTAVSSDLKTCCRKVAKEAIRDLKKTSPIKTEKYAKSWKSTITAENSQGINIVIHNGRYQLCHLLENGHAKRGGGRVAPIPHIRAAEEAAKQKLMEEIERIL